METVGKNKAIETLKNAIRNDAEGNAEYVIVLGKNEHKAFLAEYGYTKELTDFNYSTFHYGGKSILVYTHPEDNEFVGVYSGLVPPNKE